MVFTLWAMEHLVKQINKPEMVTYILRLLPAGLLISCVPQPGVMSQGRLYANFTTCPFWANCQKALPLWGSISKNLSFFHIDTVLPWPRPPESPWPWQPPTGNHQPTGQPVGRLPLGLQYHLYSRASCSFIVQLNPSIYLPISLCIHPSIHPSVSSASTSFIDARWWFFTHRCQSPNFFTHNRAVYLLHHYESFHGYDVAHRLDLKAVTLLIKDEYLLYYCGVCRGERLRRNDDFQFLRFVRIFTYIYI